MNRTQPRGRGFVHWPFDLKRVQGAFPSGLVAAGGVKRAVARQASRVVPAHHADPRLKVARVLISIGDEDPEARTAAKVDVGTDQASSTLLR